MEKVSKKMMDKLNYIRAHKLEYGTQPLLFLDDIVTDEYVEISEWYWQQIDLANTQLKLVEHVFGDTPQFEEEKPKKYVVQSKETDRNGYYWTLCETDFGVYNFGVFLDTYKFDTREEAEQWTNPQTEVVEVEE